ncbi:MAG: YceI family protein [Pseudobdellovibrionaceae bacterium]
MKTALIFVMALFLCPISFAETGVSLKFKLSPVGDFTAKSKDVQGLAFEKGSEVYAENIIVPVKSLSTGIDLRDEHMKNKYLDIKKFPEVKLIKAKGSAGKGKALLEIKGIKKIVSGTYKVDNKELTAQFSLKLSDYKISGIKYLGVGVNDEIKIEVTVPVK